MPVISYTPFFVKKFQKLPEKIKKQAVKKEVIFKQNIRDTRLKTHKLAGKLDAFYSFSVNRQYRIMFALAENGEVVFVDIGTHSIYQ